MLALVTGSGRCGTNSVAAFLDGRRGMDGRRIAARHETEWQEIVAALLDGRDDLADRRLGSMPHDIEVSPFLSLPRRRPLADAGVKLVGVIRDGRKTVRSGMTNGWYWNPERDPRHWVNLKPRLAGDRFEQCCRFWAWTYLRLARWGADIFRLEDLAGGPAGRNRLLATLGLAPSNAPFPHRNPTEAPSRGAAPAEAAAAWPSPFPAADHWTAGQKRTFERHCGRVMDRYYPCWRETAAPGPSRPA